MLHQSTVVKKIKSALMLSTGQFESYYWSRGYVKSSIHEVADQRFDVILANDLMTLPLAIKIANGQSRVIFDAHEYAPREFEDRWVWRIFFQKLMHNFCQRYLPMTDGMMTVCQGIADEYESEYGVKPLVVTNASALSRHSTKPDGKWRDSHDSSWGRHVLTSFGENDRDDEFLDERFRLDFMLISSDPRYFDYLKKLASNDARIRFIEPVAMQDIPKVSNQYDIGVFLLPPVNFNYLHALPNKLFEFIQARLAVAIGPSPEMKRLVEQYDCGVVADDFSPQSLAKSLSGLTEDRICYFKQQAHQAASVLCAEHNAKTIIDLVEGC